MFVGSLLCARFCSEHWGCISEQTRQISLPFQSWHRSWGDDGWMEFSKVIGNMERTALKLGEEDLKSQGKGQVAVPHEMVRVHLMGNRDASEQDLKVRKLWGRSIQVKETTRAKQEHAVFKHQPGSQRGVQQNERRAEGREGRDLVQLCWPLSGLWLLCCKVTTEL